jgi:hypothetical protein
MSALRLVSPLLLALALVLPCRGEPPVVSAPHTKGAIVIDGVLDEEIWNRADGDAKNSATGWISIAHPDRPSFDRRTVRLAWDEENLYVALKAEAGDESQLPETASGGEDTLRMDFKEAALGITSSGAQLQDILLPYLIPIQAAAKEDNAGWTAEVSIPWAHLKIHPQAGLQIPFNVAGQDMSGEISWARVRDFRDTDQFGHLELK